MADTGSPTLTSQAFDGTPYRLDQTVQVLRGDRRGAIGRVIAVGRRDGQATGTYMVQTMTPGSSVALQAHHSDLIPAAHPWSWYQGVHSTHGPCERCDAAQAALNAAAVR